ncbi:MAG TPA: COX15/CtaA family protein [Mycobacteriales bacterium]|nr:COX15/CtaA family protein [Mycobacteriales bacterium]
MPVLPHASATAVRRLAVASVVANCGIVVTGGAVRLTGSGLGCPTWPRCTGQSYVPTQALAWHGLVEFGNRMLTFALSAVVLVTFLAAIRSRPRRRPLVGLSLAGLLGIPAQAVLGGITVLTGLNPWTVAAHFALSMALVAVSTVLWHRAAGAADTPARPVVRPELVRLAQALVAVTALTLAVGAVVTGSGPHAGDRHAVRTGFDPAVVSQLHADVVMLLVGLSVATWVALRATGAPAGIGRAAALLVGVELGQGAIGYTQYFTGLPSLLVGFHLLGACLVWVAALRLLLLTRVRVAAAVPTPADSVDRVAVPVS